MRDFQRSRLYAWERSQPWWDESDDASTPPRLTLAQCRRLVERAMQRYQATLPLIADGRGHRRATGSAYMLALPRWSRFPAAVLHECAHSINAQRSLGRGDRHGPIFVRLYIQLVAVYLKQSESELVASARAAKLKVAAHQPIREGSR